MSFVIESQGLGSCDRSVVSTTLDIFLYYFSALSVEEFKISSKVPCPFVRYDRMIRDSRSLIKHKNLLTEVGTGRQSRTSFLFFSLFFVQEV